MLTMQEALLALTRYWTEQGCMVTQPMNTEVGAGTLNPATALRVLGPEPWRVAYVEPSVRPDDSRYGDNPNRLQTHTQFQVILKPEPGNPQELYLGSLQALGIDIDAHDVRFVEDNWASPALGAWGLGWEVWLDGLEITQFTYFQQSGGMVLDPVSCEITYGMERIIMALQGVSHFKDISYAPGVSYGEAFGQAEYEMSRYYLDDADIDTNQALFDAYAAEADRLIEARLPVPAHTYVLKCSQAFNVLDARGAISTTERARAFTRMRNLAHNVAKLWVERRDELGHPLGSAATGAAAEAGEAAKAGDAVRPGEAAGFPVLDAPATLAFEIGVEEMPPGETSRAAEAVAAALADRLGATRLRHGAVTVDASPRRIVAFVSDVQPREDDAEETVRGPRLAAAYDADGAPTKAAQGFCRGQGIDVADLQPIEVGGGEYVGYVKQVPGRPAAEVLAGILPGIVSGLRADKNMRWSAPGLSYTRPIRWVTALLGDQVVPFSVAGMASGRVTRVHRSAAEPIITVESADSYLATLREHAIEPVAAARRERILAGATALAGGVGGRIDAEGEASVVDEITNLVEDPRPLLGSFDAGYLELPAAILTTVMKKHQRYLPVRDEKGALLPYFIAVPNGACDEDAVRAGNEAVLRARYEDAGFFWRNDLKKPLTDMKERLTKLTFETRLGSVADRAGRIGALAGELAGLVELDEAEREALRRAGELAKFDLGSEMVVELSSLAGVMAEEYARRAGESEAVARALFEMELPRQAGDALPASRVGALLALADRFDLLAGLFGIGSAPTGSSDPFGLRRAALGVVNILRAHPDLTITVPEGLALAAARQPVPVADEVLTEAAEFVARRFEQAMIEAGHPVEHVRAAEQFADAPARAERTLDQLAALLKTEEFAQLAAALQRVRRIVPAGTEAACDAGLFESEAERALYHAAATAAAEAAGTTDLERFAAAGAVLVTPVNTFFDDVLVMADDLAVRNNRLGLLATVNELAGRFLAWDRLPG